MNQTAMNAAPKANATNKPTLAPARTCSRVNDTFDMTAAATYLESKFADQASFGSEVRVPLCFCSGAQLFCDCLETGVYVAMDDLLDEAQEYRHDDNSFECLSEDNEEYANAEEILGSHFVRGKWGTK